MTDRAFDVEYTKMGTVYDSSQVNALLQGCADATSLLVLTHGWNNDMAEARNLYRKFLTSLGRVGAGAEPLHKMTVMQVFWPSQKFALQHLIAGGGAASASAGSSEEVQESLRVLNHDPQRLGEEDSAPAAPVWSQDIGHAISLIDQLEYSETARREFVLSIRAALNPDEAHDDDASREFFELEPEVLFNKFGERVNFTPTVHAGGATGGGGLAAAGGTGGAAFLGGAFSKMKTAAIQIANYATYYKMKARAGAVGRNGLSQTLTRIRVQYPHLPVHLVGHSFGGRLIVAAAAHLESGGAPVSMSLLQAAFSHNGFAGKFDGKNDGAFRAVVKEQRISGPIVITHTKNDQAVGIAYPLASRIARDNAAALGDQNDPYGGMGRNGAQHTPEVSSKEVFLRPWNSAEAYQFSPGHLYNLRADRSIRNHSDVTGEDVANATLQAMRSVLVP